MGRYKITEFVNANPSCQRQESLDNLFESWQARESLPLLLQHYYDYLSMKDKPKTEWFYIISLKQDEESALKVDLMPDIDMSKEEVIKFFKRLEDFIDYEDALENNFISITIRGNDSILAIYSEYKDSIKKALETKKMQIDAQVQQEMKPTVLKWTGGVSVVLGCAGFALGGPIGGVLGAAFGVSIGPFIGINATSVSNLSSSIKNEIKLYDEKARIQAGPLQIVGIELGSIPRIAEQKFEESVQATSIDASAERRRSNK